MVPTYYKGHTTSRPDLRHLVHAALLGGLAVLALASCVYDSDKRCGPNEVLSVAETETCVCDEHSVGTADGCVPCGKHELVGPTGCECEAGYSRPSPTKACALGETICAGDGDCPDGQACDLKVSPSVCRMPPVGQGKACTASSDCAGTEATICDIIGTKACTVEGCTLTPDNCYPGYVCCDLAKFGLKTTACSLGACL
jgi:hypothetical protein